MQQLLWTVYSVLYYNAVIWLTPELSSSMKQSLLSISANALRSCTMSKCTEISLERLHLICRKCTPSQIMSYQSSIRLYKTVNEIFESCTSLSAELINNVICTGRQLNFEIIRNNRSKIGMNTLSNKFYHISKQISLDLLDLEFVHFKKLMKI